MAKANKKNSSKPIKKKAKKSKKFSASSLVAVVSASSMPANINVLFTSGLGQITAVLFRNGVLINMQSISTSGSIHFIDVQSGDTMAVNGVCAGNTDITVSVPTSPSTPEHFNAGIIMTGYTIL